jgi:hypothetical protein
VYQRSAPRRAEEGTIAARKGRMPCDVGEFPGGYEPLHGKKKKNAEHATGFGEIKREKNGPEGI